MLRHLNARSFQRGIVHQNRLCVRTERDCINLAVNRAALDDTIHNICSVDSSVVNVLVQALQKVLLLILLEVRVIHLDDVGHISARGLRGELIPVTAPIGEFHLESDVRILLGVEIKRLCCHVVSGLVAPPAYTDNFFFPVSRLAFGAFCLAAGFRRSRGRTLRRAGGAFCAAAARGHDAHRHGAGEDHAQDSFRRGIIFHYGNLLKQFPFQTFHRLYGLCLSFTGFIIAGHISFMNLKNRFSAYKKQTFYKKRLLKIIFCAMM